jgi:hypothetical protein
MNELKMFRILKYLNQETGLTILQDSLLIIFTIYLLLNIYHYPEGAHLHTILL